jgi:hypothetical protein
MNTSRLGHQAFNRRFGGVLAQKERHKFSTDRALSNVVLSNVTQDLEQRAKEVPVFVLLDAVKHPQKPAIHFRPDLVEGRPSLGCDADIADPHIVGARLAADVAELVQRIEDCSVTAKTESSLMVTDDDTLRTASARIWAVVMSKSPSSSATLVFHRAMMRFIK